MASPRPRAPIIALPPRDGRFIPGSGPPYDSPIWASSRRVMVVGEGPGHEEHESGLPFFDPHYYRKWGKGGASGRELTRLLGMAGLDRAACWVTNLTRYFNSVSNPGEPEVRRDARYLVDELRLYRPAYVIAVGRLATRWFLGDVAMEVVHGIPHHASLHGWDGIVIPAYHPAAGLWSPDVQPLIAYDFQQVGAVVEGKLPPHPPVDQFPTPEYREVADSDDRVVVNMLTTGHQVVSIDTEGDARHPWSLQFSTTPGTGYVIRPRSPATLAAFLLWTRVTRPLVVFHNCLHDLDVMRALGVDMVEAGIPFIDTMLLAYLLQVEPQGLKPLAYRWAGMKMNDYSDLVGPAAHVKSMAYVEAIAARSWPKPSTEMIRDGIDVRPYTPQPPAAWANRLLSDISAGKLDKDGNPPNPRARWRQAPLQTRRVVEDALGPMPEATLDDVPLDQAIGYAGRDADATLRIYPLLRRQVLAMGLTATLNIDLAVAPMVERMQHLGMPYDHDYFVRLHHEMEVAKDRTIYELSQVVGHRINPNSPDQVAAVLYGGDLKQRGQVVTTLESRGFTPIKHSRKTGKPTTNKKVVEALRTTDKAVDLIVRYREESKVDDSFAVPIGRVKEWQIRQGIPPTGRCQCTMRISRVVTGRLSATALEQGVGANLLAIPVRTELGLKIRRGFRSVPCPHCGTRRVLGTWDLDQIEMRVMADESQDPLLLEVFNDPTRDVHFETAARMFRISGATNSNHYAGVHKVRHRYPAKRVGFGVITGITGAGLVDQMRMAGIEGWTQESCDRLIEDWFGIYPGVRTYMNRCRAEAEIYGFVRDRWGRIRYLPGATSPLPRIREEALRQSHSHKIQGGAQGLMKRAMVKINDETRALNESLRTCDHHNPAEWLLQVHDEIIGEFDDDPVIKGVMNEIAVSALVNTTPLSVPLGAKGGFGHDWASLEK